MADTMVAIATGWDDPPLIHRSLVTVNMVNAETCSNGKHCFYTHLGWLTLGESNQQRWSGELGHNEPSENWIGELCNSVGVLCSSARTLANCHGSVGDPRAKGNMVNSRRDLSCYQSHDMSLDENSWW